MHVDIKQILGECWRWRRYGLYWVRAL